MQRSKNAAITSAAWAGRRAQGKREAEEAEAEAEAEAELCTRGGCRAGVVSGACAAHCVCVHAVCRPFCTWHRMHHKQQALRIAHAACMRAWSPWYGSRWKPLLPCLIISLGPPLQVANVGRPHVIASTTVRPNASYSAGWLQRRAAAGAAERGRERGRVCERVRVCVCVCA